MKLRAFSDAVTSTTVLVVVMTLAAELFSSFKELLADLAGHHWVAKSVLALLCFGLVYAFGEDGEPRLKPVLWSGSAGILIIFLFYVWHYLM